MTVKEWAEADKLIPAAAFASGHFIDKRKAMNKDNIDVRYADKQGRLHTIQLTLVLGKWAVVGT